MPTGIESLTLFTIFVGFQQFLTDGLKEPDNLAVDWIARNIYWTDGVLRRIEVARLDGSARKIIIQDKLHRPRGLALDVGDA